VFEIADAVLIQNDALYRKLVGIRLRLGKSQPQQKKRHCETP
jgi:hypothetical protein